MTSIELSDIKERWHFIDGYDNNYLVTENGDIYSYRPASDEKRGFKGLRKMKLKGLSNPKRYLSIVLCKNDVKTTYMVHRLVGKYFVDGYFEGAIIDHIDRNKHNNRYTNLRWTTQQVNVVRSYIVMDQVRNYKNWIIEYPCGFRSNILRGLGDIKRYVEEYQLPVKISMLTKYKIHNGYKLIEVAK